MLRHSYHRGFSLIELSVTLAVLGILLAVGLPSYSRWTHNSKVRNASESILQGIQRARSEAIIRNIRTTFTLGNGYFWRVTDVTANPGRVIEARNAGEVPAPITLSIHPSAPAGGLIPTTTLTFNGLGLIANNADGGASITRIDISTSALAEADRRPLRIMVGIGGILRLCDPHGALKNRTPPDLRSCP